MSQMKEQGPDKENLVRAERKILDNYNTLMILNIAYIMGAFVLVREIPTAAHLVNVHGLGITYILHRLRKNALLNLEKQNVNKNKSAE